MLTCAYCANLTPAPALGDGLDRHCDDFAIWVNGTRQSLAHIGIFLGHGHCLQQLSPVFILTPGDTPAQLIGMKTL